MVRLKELQEMQAAGYEIFQFHYGTIKRALSVLQSLQGLAFQFHYGTIKSRMKLYSRVGYEISIPLWYD